VESALADLLIDVMEFQWLRQRDIDYALVELKGDNPLSSNDTPSGGGRRNLIMPLLRRITPKTL
jgi:hypothetical protein